MNRPSYSSVFENIFGQTNETPFLHAGCHWPELRRRFQLQDQTDWNNTPAHSSQHVSHVHEMPV